MSKLLVSLTMLVLVFGMALYIFRGGAGVTDAVRDGHASVSDAVRAFDYVSN